MQILKAQVKKLTSILLFLLYSQQEEGTYIQLFQLILNAVQEWNPETVNIDFEMAAMSVILEVVPSAHLNGCFLHMKSCVWQ